MKEEKKLQQNEKKLSRRTMLKGVAAVAGAAAASIGFPGVKRASAQTPIVLKMQSTWPTKDIFHEDFVDWVKKVDEMAGGRLKIDALPAGAVVPAFELIEAVSRGTLDGGHGVPAYWFGRNRATSLLGTGPSFGLDAEGMLAWIHYGGGQELYDELLRDILKMNVVSFFEGPMPTQPLGWFKTEIKKPEDLKDVRFRTVGLAASLYMEMGAAVKILPGGEIIPAMERGVLDAAEFNNMSSDKLLGFPDVRKICMVQSYHQSAECFEIMFNKTKFDALPKDLQMIIKYACMAQSADMSWKLHKRNADDMVEMETKRGVKFIKTPKSVLVAQLKAWDKIIEKESKENPFFAKVIASQRKYAEVVVDWRTKIMIENETAYKHWFVKPVPKPVEKPAPKPAPKPAEKPAVKPAEKPPAKK
ncbi:MAG: TRAP transporter substrate-binding protein [Thermodesulfobacteriota bacterium]|nr:TRAP transporter substrate-binding protein [Thermodesulfobacteriota bacterium]